MNKGKRNRKRGLFCLFLIFCGLFMLSANAYCEKWLLLGENSAGRFLYDKMSISTTDSGLIAVTWKQVLSVDASSQAVSVSPAMKGISFAIYQDIINCREGTYESKRIRYYDRKSKLLYDTKKDELKYRPTGFRQIPPDTPIERLADIVCK